jgi:hypothetical protein
MNHECESVAWLATWPIFHLIPVTLDPVEHHNDFFKIRQELFPVSGSGKRSMLLLSASYCAELERVTHPKLQKVVKHLTALWGALRKAYEFAESRWDEGHDIKSEAWGHDVMGLFYRLIKGMTQALEETFGKEAILAHAILSRPAPEPVTQVVEPAEPKRKKRKTTKSTVHKESVAQSSHYHFQNAASLPGPSLRKSDKQKAKKQLTSV